MYFVFSMGQMAGDQKHDVKMHGQGQGRGHFYS
jgi:hypothetical protein